MEIINSFLQAFAKSHMFSSFVDFHFSIESEKMPERQVVRGLHCSRPAGLNSNQGGGDWYPQWSFCEPAFFRVAFLNLRANYPLSLHEVLELAGTFPKSSIQGSPVVSPGCLLRKENNLCAAHFLK